MKDEMIEFLIESGSEITGATTGAVIGGVVAGQQQELCLG